MKRGENEQACLKKVIKTLKTKTNVLPNSGGDGIVVENLITAQPNEQSNDFPDFICKNGFIEHFEVSVSVETRKGSVFKQKESCFERENEELSNDIKQEYLKNRFNPGVATIHTNMLRYTNNSYENFIKSFKKNFERHIESLKKYEGAKENGTFLVELKDGSLFIDEQSQFTPYAISGDKALLEYLYGFKNLLMFVVFYDRERLELIKLAVIPEILKHARDGIKFKAGSTISNCDIVCMDISL